jgi:membrane protein implicated in regulation of membrane protease activity
MSTSLLWIWLGMGALLILVEVLTVAFVASYLAVGALAAAGSWAIGVPLVGQVAVFSAVSVGLLALTRRVIVRLVRTARGLPETPGRELIGRVGLVTREIGPHRAGQVRIGTEPWTARAYDAGDEPMPPGTAVEVMLVEGATALVHPLPEGRDALVDS